MVSILYEYGENRLICLPIAFSWSLPRLVYHLDTGPQCNNGTTRPSQLLYRQKESRNTKRTRPERSVVVVVVVVEKVG
jgi:hypothetical protein